MSTHEDVIKDLKEKNNELVQKVQYWKMAAAQREDEKLELMKEINDLRLKLARIRSGGAAQARNLDAALQSASEEALSHLVQASGAVAHTIELAKTYMRDRQELDNSSPRWSNISGTSKVERIHRVPPMMMGGQSIQPVVSLSRAIFNTSNPRVAQRSPTQNRSITERAVPMHMLQDVYIPLTRIDVNDLPANHVETDGNNVDNSSEDLILEDSTERSLIDESQNITEEDFETSRRLDAVSEDLEPEDDVITPPPSRSRVENPLEGPSWLLDVPTSTKPRSTLEPDSTTELDDSARSPPPARPKPPAHPARAEKEPPPLACEFSPTVRRRKRATTPSATPPRASPPPAPTPGVTPPLAPPPARRLSNSGRILKVLVAKMRLDDSGGSAESGGSPEGSGGSPGGARGSGGSGGDASPPKRAMRDTPPPRHTKAMRFDAPSPNGATDAGVIVSEALLEDSSFGAGGDSRNSSVTSRGASVTSRDTSVTSRDSDRGGRTRRARAPVAYKEKPLNRKMRR